MQEENILIVMFTNDKMLLFGSPKRDQIQYLLGDEIQHVLIQKKERKTNCFQVFPRLTINATLVIDFLRFDKYNHTNGLEESHLKSEDCELESVLLDTQLFTLLRCVDNQCLKESTVLYMKVIRRSPGGQLLPQQEPCHGFLQTALPHQPAPELLGGALPDQIYARR